MPTEYENLVGHTLPDTPSYVRPDGTDDTETPTLDGLEFVPPVDIKAAKPAKDKDIKSKPAKDAKPAKADADVKETKPAKQGEGPVPAPEVTNSGPANVHVTDAIKAPKGKKGQ